MSRKIELIREGSNWHWIILEWKETGTGYGWCNICNGVEATYSSAASMAKDAYDEKF